ncbi:MAG TPA: hypothetical protein VGV38_20100, partial [Pyrinomonadaceae bacterium]|nr:hypothetical protein [Pyrinomonadaceae bacterium]
MNTTFLGFKGFRALTAAIAVLAAVLACGASAPAHAQETYAVQRAQEAVRERILREQGSRGNVSFPAGWRAETYRVDNNQTGVRGEGTFARDYNDRTQRFTYEAIVNTRNGRTSRVTYNFTGYYDDRPGNDDFGDRNVPRWLVGTFRGQNPAGRQGVTVDVIVDTGGNVTVVHPNGSRETGTYSNRQFHFSARPSWDVARAGREGFRASTRRRTEEFIRIDRGYDDGGGGGATGRVQNWAQGTFRGMTDSGESELTIRADGSASARSLRTGETFYGNYDGRTLRFDWGDYDVQRER